MKIALQVSQAWPDVADVFNVGYAGACIGRVWLDRSANDLPWEWLISVPMQLPVTAQGRAGSHSGALNAFASEWAKLISVTPESRMDRVLAFARELEAGPMRKPQAADVQIDNAVPAAGQGRVVLPPLPTTVAARQAQHVSKTPIGEPGPDVQNAPAAHTTDSTVQDDLAYPQLGEVTLQLIAALQPPNARPDLPQPTGDNSPEASEPTETQLPTLTVAAVNHPPASQKLPRDLQAEKSDHAQVILPPTEHKQPGSSIFRDIAAVLSRHA